MKTYTLYELNEFLRRVIALNFNEAIWVSAEIAQINPSRGHYYIDLLQKEETDIVAQLSAVIWATDFKRIQRTLGAHTEGVLAEGIEVKLKGRLDYHEKFGLKFIIEDIDATYTLGKLELQRRELISELTKKGILYKNGQLPLPTIIQKIAVISSDNAAGWIDFRTHMQNNDYAYGFDIQLFQSAMQGSLVEKTMLHQLEQIVAQKHYFDCVVIIRGGGAKLDLVAFDNPSICKTVAAFPLPVLTGIGHEIDQSVLDMVAHSALKTPTAVADFIISHNHFYDRNVSELYNYIYHYALKRVNTEGIELQQLESILKFKTNSLINIQKNMLDYCQNNIHQYSNNKFKFEHLQLNNFEKIIKLLSIETTLKRGFTITKSGKKTLKSVAEIKKGDTIETIFIDGSINSISN